MFAYLQFVTWLVYFSFRSFRTHLCPDGLISKRPRSRKKKKKNPTRLKPHISELSDTAQAPHFKWGLAPISHGKLQETGANNVFSLFMYFHKSSSWPLKLIFFTKNCIFSKKRNMPVLKLNPLSLSAAADRWTREVWATCLWCISCLEHQLQRFPHLETAVSSRSYSFLYGQLKMHILWVPLWFANQRHNNTDTEKIDTSFKEK